MYKSITIIKNKMVDNENSIKIKIIVYIIRMKNKIMQIAFN